MFGVQVDSNAHVDQIQVESTLLANDDATELLVTVRVEPPATA